MRRRTFSLALRCARPRYVAECGGVECSAPIDLTSIHFQRRSFIMAMKWYGFWRSLASNRVRIALALKGLQAEEVSINLLQGQQHGDDYRAVNPQRVIPALVVDGGQPIFQSLAILEYLDETKPEPP